MIYKTHAEILELIKGFVGERFTPLQLITHANLALARYQAKIKPAASILTDSCQAACSCVALCLTCCKAQDILVWARDCRDCQWEPVQWQQIQNEGCPSVVAVPPHGQYKIVVYGSQPPFGGKEYSTLATFISDRGDTVLWLEGKQELPAVGVFQNCQSSIHYSCVEYKEHPNKMICGFDQIPQEFEDEPVYDDQGEPIPGAQVADFAGEVFCGIHTAVTISCVECEGAGSLIMPAGEKLVPLLSADVAEDYWALVYMAVFSLQVAGLSLCSSLEEKELAIKLIPMYKKLADEAYQNLRQSRPGIVFRPFLETYRRPDLNAWNWGYSATRLVGVC